LTWKNYCTVWRPSHSSSSLLFLTPLISTAVTEVEQWLQNFRHFPHFEEPVSHPPIPVRPQRKAPLVMGFACVTSTSMKKSSRVTAHASPTRRVPYVAADILMTNARSNISRDGDGVEESLLFRFFLNSVNSCFWECRVTASTCLSIIYFDRRSRVSVLFQKRPKLLIFLSLRKCKI
jgi:hypothetical protein